MVMEDGRPDTLWYQCVKLMWDAFNRTSRDVADASSGLTTKAAKTQSEALTGAMPFAADGDCSFFCPYDDLEITETTTVSATGTCTATFKREGVAFDGTANDVSTSEETQAHTAIAFSKGDLVTVSVSDASSCEGFAFMLSGTRTLS